MLCNGPISWKQEDIVNLLQAAAEGAAAAACNGLPPCSHPFGAFGAHTAQNDGISVHDARLPQAGGLHRVRLHEKQFHPPHASAVFLWEPLLQHTCGDVSSLYDVTV